MARGCRFDAGRQHIQLKHILPVTIGVKLDNLHWLKRFNAGFNSNFILALICIIHKMADIRDISHVAHFITDVFEITKKEIKGNGRTGMAKMCFAINGRTADINTNMSGIQRYKNFLCPAKCII